MIKKNFKQRSITNREGIVDMYLKDIRKSIPDADIEKALIDVYYNPESSDAEKTKARNAIVTMNQKFIFSLAKGYAGNDDVLAMDLVNVGSLGMIEAFPHYDKSTGNRFCTFAKYYICRAINNFLGDENLLVRPTNNMKLAPKIRKIEEDFEKENNLRKPTLGEIEDILEKKYGIKLSSKAEIAPVVIDRFDTISSEDDDERDLAKSANFNSRTAVENEYAAESDLESLKSDIKASMSVLSEREATVIKMAFSMDEYLKEYNNNEIGEALDLTAERVRQIKKEALEKVKKAYIRKASL